MARTLSIIHFTDIHIKESNASDVKRRVADFVAHASKHSLTPDIMVISGDLTFSGTSDEFALFDKIFLKPVCAVLRISNKNLIIIPGNHDVQREIVTAPEINFREKLMHARDAENTLVAGRIKRLSNFYDYLDTHEIGKGVLQDCKSLVGGNATTRIIKISGMTIGIACLNTAWQCVDDHDKGKLLLTECQVTEAVEQISSCDLKIAVCHHPGDWLHVDEHELAFHDLKREFDVVLSGHLHDPDSHYSLEPAVEHLWFVGRAFFDGKVGAIVEDGFHFYEIDVPSKKFIAKYRRYIRKRGTFVADTSHADEGEHEFPLPLTKRIFGSEAIVVQRLAEQGSILHKEIRKELSLLQDTQNPIIVTPKLCKVSFDGGKKTSSQISTSIIEIIKGNSIVSGSQDSGKSIFLKCIAAESQISVSERTMHALDDLRPSLYFRFPSHISINSIDDLEDLVLKELNETFSTNPNSIQLRLLIDDLKKDIPESASIIQKLCTKNGWTYVLAISNDLARDAIAQSPEFVETAFYDIQPWGPSKIKEMAVRLFENTGIDAELAFKCVKRSLAEYDLPATPTTVSLYFSLVAKSGGTMTGVSFLRLLEKIEESRIGVDEKPPINDRYHRRQLLYLFASKMLESCSDSIDFDEAKNLSSDYFSKPKLGDHSRDVMLSLEKSGIIVIDNNRLAFVNFVFMNYYIALGVADGVISENSVSSDLTQCVCLAQSLALFAGMRRGNTALAEKVLMWIEERFPEPESRKLIDLDQYVNSLLEPSYDEKLIDNIVEKDLSHSHDHSNDDESYQNGRTDVASSRKALFSQKRSITLDELSAHTSGLYAFYGVLKNLDGIDGERKVWFLSRILDFHIRTNFFLIDYFHSLVPDDDFRSIAAYMLTWSGHKFMAASLGSQALCEAAKECIKQTTNDFKELLLILLLSDLRDNDGLKLIQSFINRTGSRAAVEIVFVHLRQRMIEHESATIPTELVAVFRATFQRRQRSYSKSSDKQKESHLFEKILRDAKRQHSAIRQFGIHD